MNRRLRVLVWRAGWPVRQALLIPIRVYRLSFGHLVGGNCRFYPSCSAYAEGALERSGVLRGLALSAWRVARCSPLSQGGVDYPPEGRSWRELHSAHGNAAPSPRRIASTEVLA